MSHLDKIPFIYSENPTKYPGSLKYLYNRIAVSYKKGEKRIHLKDFFYDDYDESNKKYTKTEKAAEQFRRDWAVENGLAKNLYKIDPNTNIVYVIFNHNDADSKDLQKDKKDDLWLKVDLDHLDKIEKYVWYPKKGEYTYYADTMIPSNKKLGIKRHHRFLHQMITGRFNVDHINNNGLDNTTQNLRIYNDPQKQNSIQRYNTKQRKDNTSGFTGVYYGRYNDYDYWFVKGYDFDGKRVFKKFGISKYGEATAYSMACAYRDNNINLSFDIENKKYGKKKTK
jgi:hypothetical protein